MRKKYKELKCEVEQLKEKIEFYQKLLKKNNINYDIEKRLYELTQPIEVSFPNC